MSPIAYATAQIVQALPRARVGRAVGRLAAGRWPPWFGRAVVGLYCRAYGVELDECAERGGWSTFDEFFTRRLREGARALDGDARTIVSPADGRIDAMGPIGPKDTFVVKGRPYSVGELLGDPREAPRFYGGTGCVVYLSPRDYHRVHAPVSGDVRRVRSIPGDYYPVNGIGLRHVPNLFCRNRRVVIEIDAGPGLGSVAVVMVSAMIVGRITTFGVDADDVPFGDHAFDPPLRVERGQEIGVFHLGSTVVMLAQPRAGRSWVAGVGPVRYGQALLRVESRRENGAARLGGSGLEAGG